LHQVFLVSEKEEDISETQELANNYIVYNYHERMCLFHPVSQRLHSHELRQLSCIDVWPPHQPYAKAELLAGYLGGRIEIVKISNTFQCKEDWSCRGFGDVSCCSWVRSNWTASPHAVKKRKQFLVTFQGVPGVIFMYDRTVRPEALHEYLKKRTRVSREKHRPAVIGQQSNPVQIWDITHCQITCMKWSPNNEFLAVGNEEGSVLVLNFLTREKKVEFRSYFGATTALAWSPDSKYLVSGGQDDLVCVWDIANRSCLAVGEGHTSWITDLDFEHSVMSNFEDNSEENPYRFISTARDTKIIFWTFLPTDFPQTSDGPGPKIHPRLNLGEVPRIECTNVNAVLEYAISAALWTRRFFITSDTGKLSVWRRSDDKVVLQALADHAQNDEASRPRRRTPGSY